MSAPQPLSLLAELTYRCNLQCPYCYNPLDLHAYRDELDEAAWLRVIDQAAALGVLQVHFSGGEPTLRPDLLVALVRRARERQLYSNLITQGTFLDDVLLDRLLAAGLDHVQISLQGVDAPAAERIAGTDVHDRKIAALERVLTRDVAVTLNYPLHRQNIETVAGAIALAERLGVRRLELANVQLYGWAFLNRAGLLPSRDQAAAADAIVRSAQQRLAGSMEITYVLADYYEQYPKPCMHGWGQRFMTVVPDGRVLPCPAAAAISTLTFDSVRERIVARYMGAIERIRGLPRNFMDAGTVPLMPAQRDRFRRLPLSGVLAHRRCRRDRSGVRPLTEARYRRGCVASGAWRRHHSPQHESPSAALGLAAVELTPVEARHVARDVDDATVGLDEHADGLDAFELDEDRAGARGGADDETVFLELLDDLALFVGFVRHAWRALPLEHHKPLTRAQRHRFGAAAGVQLREDRADVELDGVLGDA